MRIRQIRNRKRAVCFAVCAMIFSLTACGKKENDPVTLGDLTERQDTLEEAERPEDVESLPESTETAVLEGLIEEQTSVGNQLKVIAANMSLEGEDASYGNEIYQYAVTDLDRNGRLELIVSVNEGTGFYTYSEFYEVSETYDSLRECTADFPEGDSQPDIMNEAATAYYDTDAGTYHYIFYDLLKASFEVYYENKRAVTLQNGQISQKALAFSTATYSGEDGTEDTTYKDASGKQITEEEYDSIEDTAFAGMKKYKVSFGWCDVSELDGLNGEDAVPFLQASYDRFSFQEE